jgi:hypothetical protein
MLLLWTVYRSIGPDVGGLLYTTNIDRSVEEQHHQQLWCHASHVKQHLHPSIPLYVLDLVEEQDTEIS